MTWTYDPYCEAVHADPYPFYRRLRDEHPVYSMPRYGLWALSRYDDILAASRDLETFSNASGVDFDRPAQLFGPGNMLDSDPPRHDALRAVVRASFTAKAIAVLEAEIYDTVNGLLRPYGPGAQVDLGQALAWSLPVLTITSMLGLPAEDLPILSRWLQQMGERPPGSDQVPPAGVVAAVEMRSYLAEQLRARRKRPVADLLSHIAHAAIEDGESHEEGVGLSFLLFAAGSETTASLLSSSIVTLAGHPEQRAALVHEPERLPAAIEELIRYEAPVQVLSRVTTRAAIVQDCEIPEGARVLFLYGSANRDPRRFPMPDKFDISRKAIRHLGFGNGIHFCLGSHLARLEARVALSALLRRFPEYELSAPPTRHHSHVGRGLNTVPVVL